MQDAVRKGWAQVIVYRTRTMRSVANSQLSRKSSWPPQPTEHKRSTRRRQALPLVDQSDVTVLGKVESGKGEKVIEVKTLLLRKSPRY